MEVTGLWIYPVKSCAGVPVDAAAVAARGFAGDRRWMVVDGDGRFITQRERPELSQVRVALDGDELVLETRGAPALRVAVPPDGPRREIQVWDYRGPAVIDAAGSAWMARFLGAPAALVHLPDDVVRPVNPVRGRPGDQVSFADGYPFLLIAQASLDDLNARLAAPVTMARFRPNVVVGGATPYAEDRWKRVTIGGVSFRAVKRCERCAITLVDPDSGARGLEPLRTLATYRRSDDAVFFGMNLIHDGGGVLRVGDAVTAEGRTA